MRIPTWSVLAAAVAASLSLAMSSPVSGGFSSDNVEWVRNIPRHAGTAGGILRGDHYYLTDPRGVYIYDLSEDAEDPVLVGELLAAQLGTNVVFAQEEPDTNGEILLVDAVAPTSWSAPASVPGTTVATSGGMHPESPAANAKLLVVDVSDRSDPHVVASLDVTDHTWECVLDCTYAYGRSGHVIDLTDPGEPREVADWREVIGGEEGRHEGYMHDFSEVAPGRLIGSGQPSLYLDVTDPANPVELARIDPEFFTLGYHGAVWPNGATDRFLLMGAELAPAVPGTRVMQYAGSDCNDADETDEPTMHALATYDATEVLAVDEVWFNDRDERGRDSGRKTGRDKQRAEATFEKLFEWRIDGRGAYVDGKAPAHTLYCGHWVDVHPTWDDGGLLAIAHYDWGVRFLEVGADGSFADEEAGWFQPVGGYTGSAKWIDEDTIYVHDYRRGLDILRVDVAGAD